VLHLIEERDARVVEEEKVRITAKGSDLARRIERDRMRAVTEKLRRDVFE
jgi:hypothetical protein